MEVELKELATLVTKTTGIPPAALSRVTSLMLGGDERNYALRAMFGLGELPDQLSRAATPEQRYNIFMDSVKQMVDRLTPFVEGAQTNRIRQALLESIGITATQTADLMKIVKNEDRQKLEEALNFCLSIS